MCLSDQLWQATLYIRPLPFLVANKLMTSEAPAWLLLGLGALSYNLDMLVSVLHAQRVMVAIGGQRIGEGDSFTEEVCQLLVEILSPACRLEQGQGQSPLLPREGTWERYQSFHMPSGLPGGPVCDKERDS